jgi:hypothetical protein
VGIPSVAVRHWTSPTLGLRLASGGYGPFPGSSSKKKEVADASQILLRDAHVLLKLLSFEEYCRRGIW